MRLLTLTALMGLAACTDNGGPLTLDIAGTWTDEFDTTHLIGAEVWEQVMSTGSSTFDIVDFDNDDDWAVAQNGASNDYFPGLYSRFEWVEQGGQLYFCQVLFDGKAEQDAHDAGPADATNPADAGCNGFGWSELNP